MSADLEKQLKALKSRVDMLETLINGLLKQKVSND